MKKILYIFLVATFSLGVYAIPVQNPPEPQNKSHNGNGQGPPCAAQGQGRGVPPPVGLCLPINDYLLPLLISGILLGVYKVRRVPKT